MLKRSEKLFVSVQEILTTGGENLRWSYKDLEEGETPRCAGKPGDVHVQRGGMGAV